VNSRLRVTRICSVGIDVQNNVRAGVAVTKSFRVLMRSPADVTLLERPSWWTPAHALILLGLALTVTLCVLSWVVILERGCRCKQFSSAKANRGFVISRSMIP